MGDYLIIWIWLDMGTHLEKVQFASVVDDQLQFLPGESSDTVYGGTYTQWFKYVQRMYMHCL